MKIICNQNKVYRMFTLFQVTVFLFNIMSVIVFMYYILMQGCSQLVKSDLSTPWHHKTGGGGLKTGRFQ